MSYLGGLVSWGGAVVLVSWGAGSSRVVREEGNWRKVHLMQLFQ